jgi:hypothetical protein
VGWGSYFFNKCLKLGQVRVQEGLEKDERERKERRGWPRQRENNLIDLILIIELASKDFSPVAVPVIRPALTPGHAPAPAPVNKTYYKRSPLYENIILTNCDVIIELTSRNFRPVAVLVVRPATTSGHALAPAPVNIFRILQTVYIV